MRTRPKMKRAQGGYINFWCPGCDEAHTVRVGPGWWEFQGSEYAPSFTPSILVTKGDQVCHSWVTAGSILYLDDTTHRLRRQTVVLPDWPFK